MIINFNAVFKVIGISKSSYYAKQIRYAFKGAAVLNNNEITEVVGIIQNETARVIKQLESMKEVKI